MKYMLVALFAFIVQAAPAAAADLDCALLADLGGSLTKAQDEKQLQQNFCRLNRQSYDAGRTGDTIRRRECGHAASIYLTELELRSGDRDPAHFMISCGRR